MLDVSEVLNIEVNNEKLLLAIILLLVCLIFQNTAKVLTVIKYI